MGCRLIASNVWFGAGPSGSEVLFLSFMERLWRIFCLMGHSGASIARWRGEGYISPVVYFCPYTLSGEHGSLLLLSREVGR